jgi:hypothetical protein
MANSPTRVTQARLDVFWVQVGEFSQDLLRRQTTREEVENIGDANPHAADARSPPALLRIDCDALS